MEAAKGLLWTDLESAYAQHGLSRSDVRTWARWVRVLEGTLDFKGTQTTAIGHPPN